MSTPKYWLVAIAVLGAFFGFLSLNSGFSLHKTLHFGALTLTLFLLFASILTFWRTRRKRLLYVSGGFLFYALRELILFSDIVLTTPIDFSIPLLQSEASHLLSLVVLALFSVGILRE